MHVNLRSNKIRKITNLVDFHSLYQLLLSQVYCHDFLLESCLKYLLVKKFDTKKASRADLIKKGPDAVY